MKLIFLLSVLVFLAIFAVSLKGFFKNYLGRRKEKIIKSIFMIGVSYIILGIVVTLWFFDALIYSSNDYLAIYSILVVVQTLFLFRIVFLLTSNRKLYYALFLYLISFLSIFSPISVLIDFFNFSLAVSFLFMVVFFVYLTSINRLYRKIGYAGILYSLVSLTIQILILINERVITLFEFNATSFFHIIVFIYSIFYFVLTYTIVNDIKRYHLSHTEHTKYQKIPYPLLLLRHFIFIVVLANFIFIGTIGIHELGHFTISELYDCDHRRIIYDGSFPHTEILCEGFVDNNVVLIGGIFTPLILSLIIILFGGDFIRSVAFLMIGFNLIASSKDFLDMGISDNLILVSLFSGLIFSVVGIMMLAKSKVDSDFET